MLIIIGTILLNFDIGEKIQRQLMVLHCLVHLIKVVEVFTQIIFVRLDCRAKEVISGVVVFVDGKPIPVSEAMQISIDGDGLHIGLHNGGLPGGLVNGLRSRCVLGCGGGMSLAWLAGLLGRRLGGSCTGGGGHRLGLAVIESNRLACLCT